MRQMQHSLLVKSEGRGLFEFTKQVADWLDDIDAQAGLLTLFCRHTSASLLVQENADPDVRTDLENFFSRIAPEDGDYIHKSEGSDDMPAHIRAALTLTQLSVPVTDGRMTLGTWQGIYLFEHRAAPHGRKIALHYIGT